MLQLYKWLYGHNTNNISPATNSIVTSVMSSGSQPESESEEDPPIEKRNRLLLNPMCVSKDYKIHKVFQETIQKILHKSIIKSAQKILDGCIYKNYYFNNDLCLNYEADIEFVKQQIALDNAGGGVIIEINFLQGGAFYIEIFTLEVTDPKELTIITSFDKICYNYNEGDPNTIMQTYRLLALVPHTALLFKTLILFEFLVQKYKLFNYYQFKSLRKQSIITSREVTTITFLINESTAPHVNE